MVTRWLAQACHRVYELKQLRNNYCRRRETSSLTFIPLLMFYVMLSRSCLRHVARTHKEYCLLLSKL